MAQTRLSNRATGWQEWVILLGIVGLFAVGVGAIWGGTIHRWIDRGGDEAPADPAPAAPAAPGRVAL